MSTKLFTNDKKKRKENKHTSESGNGNKFHCVSSPHTTLYGIF